MVKKRSVDEETLELRNYVVKMIIESTKKNFNLSQEELIGFVEKVSSLAAKDLCLKNPPKVVVCDFSKLYTEKERFGDLVYHFVENTIQVDSSWFKRKTRFLGEVAASLFHEYRHVWQHENNKKRACFYGGEHDDGKLKNLKWQASENEIDADDFAYEEYRNLKKYAKKSFGFVGECRFWLANYGEEYLEKKVKHIIAKSCVCSINLAAKIDKRLRELRFAGQKQNKNNNLQKDRERKKNLTSKEIGM